MESLRGVSASMVPSDRALFSYLWILRKLELLRILDYGNKNIFNDLRFWLLMTTKDPRLYRRRKRRFLKHFAIRRRALIEDRCKKETIELIIRYSDKGNLRASAENEYVARLVIIFLRRALESTST
ncbi:MAG: hypothetical protein DRJ67_04365 [Thermoprotei archaeon]|nr:MAG: hypothetical protein DRJ67_04365 [Thermoprotei archaeon]